MKRQAKTWPCNAGDLSIPALEAERIPSGKDLGTFVSGFDAGRRAEAQLLLVHSSFTSTLASATMHKRRTMKRIIPAAVAIAIVMTANISQAGQITYSLQNYAADQAGFTLTGSVTTDGNLGTLTTADIVAWTWTVSSAGGASFTLSLGPGISTSVLNLVATETQLLVPELQTEQSDIIFGGGVVGSAVLAYRREENNGIFLYAAVTSSPSVGWDTENPAMGGTNPWVIGVAATTVPEPSAVVLMSLGISGLLINRELNRSSRKRRSDRS